MADTLQNIIDSIRSAELTDQTLYPVPDNSTSTAGIRRRMRVVVAGVVQQVQDLFAALCTEIQLLIDLLVPHTVRWYANKAKLFQYGYALPTDSDRYNNTGLTNQQIAVSQIVSYAACVERYNPQQGSFLRMKLAKTVSSDLAPLVAAELLAFSSYMERIKDAGVLLVIDSLPADSLMQVWDVYVDPLVINVLGARIDGSDPAPVEGAIRNYLFNLPFNGLYRPTYHVDAVQKVDGVKDPILRACSATYGSLPYSSIGTQYEPDSGYLRFVNSTDLIINYLPLN